MSQMEKEKQTSGDKYPLIRSMTVPPPNCNPNSTLTLNPNVTWSGLPPKI